jgi:hypothetical protein
VKQAVQSPEKRPSSGQPGGGQRRISYLGAIQLKLNEVGAMSDRTMLAVGANKLSVPRLVKRTMQVAVATALTAAVLFVIVVTNGMLLARGGATQGFGLWLTLIGRSDVLPMIVLTSIVTIAYLTWERNREKR